MTVLAPMPQEAFRNYLEAAVAGYAVESVAAGRWPQAGALERSRADFETLLPRGLATPDNHLFEIRATTQGTVVGVLWFAVETRFGERSAHVFDVEIQPGHRRQGHARAALEALEPLAEALGIGSIGLHVFAHNLGAQALYVELGYGVTGLNMVKRLGGPA